MLISFLLMLFVLFLSTYSLNVLFDEEIVFSLLRDVALKRAVGGLMFFGEAATFPTPELAAKPTALVIFLELLLLLLKLLSILWLELIWNYF